MDENSKKRSTLFPHAWFKSLEKLPDDIAGRIYKAVQRLDITGEMTDFESGSMEDILFSQYAFQTNEFGQNYAKTCKRKSDAAKKREAEKKAQKAQRAQGGTAEPQRNSVVDDRSGVEWIGKERIGKDVSGGEVSGEDAPLPPSADTTTTTLPDGLAEEIVAEWNAHEFTQKVVRITSPKKRFEKTLKACDIVGGPDQFLALVRSLGDHAYLRRQTEKGYTVIYDWFIDPENLQGVIEGRYKDDRNGCPDGYEEVVL